MKFKNNKIKLKNKNITSNKIDVSNFKIYEFKEGWAVIVNKKTSKCGWISEDYIKLINPVFDTCYDFIECCTIFKKNDKYGLINTDGLIIAEEFDYCSFFRNGSAIFKEGNKKGYIDKNGKKEYI